MSGDRFKSLSVEEFCAVGCSVTSRQPELDHVADLVQMWQRETFGGPATRSGCTSRLEHLRREVVEAKEASSQVDRWGGEGGWAVMTFEQDRDALASELADIGILWLSACAEAGMDPAVVMFRKLQENRGRTWGPVDSDGCIEHVEGGES